MVTATYGHLSAHPRLSNSVSSAHELCLAVGAPLPMYVFVHLCAAASEPLHWFQPPCCRFFKGSTYPRSESSQSSFTSCELQRKGEAASLPTATNPLDRGRRLNSVYHVCCLIYAEGAGGNSQAGRCIMGQDRDTTKFLASSFLLEELLFLGFPHLKKKNKEALVAVMDGKDETFAR